MPDSQLIYTPSPREGALRQSEILSDLVQSKLSLESIRSETENPEIEYVTHPFVMVMSQDCDLELDYKARNGIDSVKQDKMIPNILFCEITTAGKLFELVAGADVWKRIRQNDHPRYQFLQKAGESDDALGQGLPELGIDFKRYFSLPTDEVYLRMSLGKTYRRCFMKNPYLEHVTTRFYAYKSRVALPVDHQSE